MLFVCLSHFTAGYLWKTGGHNLAVYLTTMSMVASPTFVTVSGMVVGFLAATNPLGFAELRLKLVDRGLFLLLVGHLLLTAALMPAVSHFSRAYRTSFVTDAIAVAVIIGPSLVRALDPLSRIALALGIYMADWLAIMQWHPMGTAFTAKLYLVGAISPTGEIGAYPVFAVIPWFAVYLAGTVIGERFGQLYAGGHRAKAHRLLALTGMTFLLIGSASQLATMTLRPMHVSGSREMLLLNVFSIYEKFPPGLVYLAFYGGAGLLLLAVIFEADRRAVLGAVLEPLRRIGRSSLFIFTVQYWLFRTVLGGLSLPYTPFWPLLLLASIVLLAQLAAVWDANGCNRLLTVGITSDWFRSRFAAPFRALPTARLGG